MTTTVERPVIGVDDEQARLVVFALLDAAGGEPAVEVSQAVLAQSTGLDRRTLRRVLDRLEAAGWVGVERPATPNSPAVYGIAGLAQTCRDVGLTPPAPASPAVVERGPRVLSRQEATHPLDHVVEGARYLVNPEYLQAGENVRRDLRAGKGFLETVRAHGVVKDIDVYVTLTGLVVLDGHRRLDAALALHLESVPVRVVRVDDEAERIASQLMVNDEAEHCNSAERADAIQQLVLLGVPAQDLRRRGIRGEEVAAARAVASAPQAVRQAAVERPQIDLVGLGHLAELATDAVEDSPVVAKAVADAIERPEQVEHIVARARAEAEEERILADKRAELEAQGIRAFEDAREWSLYDKGQRLDSLVDDHGEVLTEATHSSCPGHAAVVYPAVTWEGDQRKVTGTRVAFWCDDWRAHGHRNRWARNTSGATSGPMDEEQRKARAEKIRRNKAMDAANGVRRQWIQDRLLTSGTRLPAVAWRSRLPLYLFPVLRWTHRGVSSIALEKGRERLACDLPSLRAVLPTAPAAEVALLTFALAAMEGSIEKDTWTDTRGVSAMMTRLHLRFLEQLGYTLSDVEVGYCQDVEDSTDASDLHQVPGTKTTTKTTRTDQAEEGQS
jgi:ParB-like chromosome segregation protein Spo0J